jgi:transcriptional regulator with XRE-family HTH domain
MNNFAEKDLLSDQEDDFESVVNHHPKTTKVVSLPDEFHPFFGQTGNLLFAEAFAPTDREVRRMLLALRRRLSWSRGFAAAVIGVTESSIEKWEKGRRKPRGASRKLIWFLHSKFVLKDDKIKNAWDLATWGQFPCRDSFQLFGKILPTLFVDDQDFLAMIAAHCPLVAEILS